MWLVLVQMKKQVSALRCFGNCFLVLRPGGGGEGYLKNVYTGRLHHEVQTLTLLCTMFDRNGISSVGNGTPFTYPQ